MVTPLCFSPQNKLSGQLTLLAEVCEHPHAPALGCRGHQGCQVQPGSPVGTKATVPLAGNLPGYNPNPSLGLTARLGKGFCSSRLCWRVSVPWLEWTWLVGGFGSPSFPAAAHLPSCASAGSWAPEPGLGFVVGDKDVQGLDGNAKACDARPPDSVLASLPIEPWPETCRADRQGRLILQDRAWCLSWLGQSTEPWWLLHFPP